MEGCESGTAVAAEVNGSHKLHLLTDSVAEKGSLAFKTAGPRNSDSAAVPAHRRALPHAPLDTWEDNVVGVEFRDWRAAALSRGTSNSKSRSSSPTSKHGRRNQKSAWRLDPYASRSRRLRETQMALTLCNSATETPSATAAPNIGAPFLDYSAAGPLCRIFHPDERFSARTPSLRDAHDGRVSNAVCHAASSSSSTVSSVANSRGCGLHSDFARRAVGPPHLAIYEHRNGIAPRGRRNGCDSTGCKTAGLLPKFRPGSTHELLTEQPPGADEIRGVLTSSTSGHVVAKIVSDAVVTSETDPPGVVVVGGNRGGAALTGAASSASGLDQLSSSAAAPTTSSVLFCNHAMSSTILSRRLRVGRQLGRGAAGVVRQAVLTIATGYARNPRHMGGIHTQTNDSIGGANTAASQDENLQFGGSPTSNADVSPSENSPSMSTNSRLVSGAESYRSGGVEVATTKASSNGDSEQASCNSPIPTASKAMDPSDESGRVGREGHSARVIDVPLRRRRANSCCVAEHYLSHAPEKTSAAQQSVSHISFEVAVKIQRQSIGLCIREIWASHCLSSRRAALRVARRRLIEDLWNPNARGSVARQDSTHHLTESCFSESPALECAPTWWCGMPFFAGPSVSTGTHTGSVSLDMDRQFATVKEPTPEFNYSKRHASHGVDVELASVAAACCPQEKTNTNGPTSTDMKGSRHISKLGSRSSFTSRIAASLSKLGGRTSFVSRGFNPDGELHHHLLAATGSITATVPEYSVLYRTSDLLGLVAAEGINLYESLRRKRRRFLPDLTTPFSGDELENVRDRFDFMHETRYSLTMLAEDMPIAAAERWANLMKIAPLHCQQKVPHQNMEVIIGSAWLSPHELHFYSALGIVEEEQDAAQGDESEAEKALAFSRLPPHLAIAATEGNEVAEQWLHDWLSSASGAEQREPAPFTKSSDHSGSSFRTTIDDDDDQEQQVEGGLDLDNTPLYAENLSQKLLRQQLAEKLQHNENNETAFVAAAIMPTVPCAINLHSLLNDMFLARQRRPSSEVTLFLVYQLCDLVAVVHEAGLVHGDVKPDNFLVFSMETLAQRSQVPSRGRSRESRRGISRLASRTAQHGSTVYAKLLRKSSATSSASSHSRPVCGAKSASLTSPPPAAPLLSTRSSVVSTTRNAARKRRDVPTLFRAASADASHPTEHHLKHPKSPNSSERIYRPHHHNDAKPSSPNHHAASRISASDLRHPSLKASSPSIRRPPPPTWGQHFPSSSNSSPLNINKEGTTASGDWRDNHPLLPCRRKVPVGVAGIDLGRALDVQEVYKGTLFTGECHVADFKPPMMLEWKKSDTASKNYEQVVKSDGVNLPPRRNQADVPGWLHHIDTFGIAGIAHCLLFGKYLKIRKIGPGAYPTRQAAADAQSGLARYGNDSKCEGLRVCGSTVDCGVAPQLPTRDCADCRSIRYGMSETIKRSVQDSDFWRDFFDALINFAPLRIAGAAKGPSAPGLEFPDVGTQIGQMSALLLRQVQWRIEQIFVEDRSRSERLHADLTSLNSLVKAHAVVAARRGG